MATKCNGHAECHGDEDEIWCNISLRVLLIFLGVGLTAITVVAVVLLTCQKKNQVVTEMELTNLMAEDQTIEEWHQDERRGKKIAFLQKSKDKRMQNQALIAFEVDYHKSYSKGIHCIKRMCDPMTFNSVMGDRGEESRPKKIYGKTKKAVNKTYKKAKHCIKPEKPEAPPRMKTETKLTTWQLTQCIIATFFNYKDITKDAFLLVKMTMSVGGAIFIEDLSSFAFLVIFGTFLTLVVPMVLTSVQVAIEAPGLPLGLANIPKGCTRTLTQICLGVFSPVTILLLRLQHEMVLKKREKIQESQNIYLFGEFNRLSELLWKFEEQRTKAMKMELSIEIFNQMFLNIILVIFALSETRTETAFEALFNQEGLDEYLNISNLTIFIISFVASFFSFMKKFVTAHANNWNWKSKLVVGLFGVINLALRLLGMIVCFIPSLGLFNVLRHYQAERIPFSNGGRYNFSSDLLYFGNAPPVAWADITRVDFSDPQNPIPPSYTIYTGLKSGEFFIIFSLTWAFHIFFLWLHSFLRNKQFRLLSWFDQIMFAFQTVITPAPSVDWADCQGDISDHVEHMKIVEKEVIGAITINSLVNICHLIPLAYLACTVTARQWLLEESIGSMEIELQAFKTVWTIFSVSMFSMIIGPIISVALFKKINSSLHPCFDIIEEEIQKDKKSLKSKCLSCFTTCKQKMKCNCDCLKKIKCCKSSCLDNCNLCDSDCLNKIKCCSSCSCNCFNNMKLCNSNCCDIRCCNPN